MRIIVLLDVDDEEGVSIATDANEDALCFRSWEAAEKYCQSKAIGRWSKCVNLDDDEDDE